METIRYTYLYMSTKIQISIIIVVLMITTLLTVGFFRLRDKAISAKSGDNNQDTSTTLPSPSPTPIQNTCVHNDECSWFTKIIETNSGTPEEKVSMSLTCQNEEYLASCGPDCTKKGNAHPFDPSASSCLCNQGMCRIEEQ